MREVLEYLDHNAPWKICDKVRGVLGRWRRYIKPGPYQIGVEMRDEADKRLRQEIEEVLK